MINPLLQVKYFKKVRREILPRINMIFALTILISDSANASVELNKKHASKKSMHALYFIRATSYVVGYQTGRMPFISSRNHSQRFFRQSKNKGSSFSIGVILSPSLPTMSFHNIF
jgi:hypothetical protein